MGKRLVVSVSADDFRCFETDHSIGAVPCEFLRRSGRTVRCIMFCRKLSQDESGNAERCVPCLEAERCAEAWGVS